MPIPLIPLVAAAFGAGFGAGTLWETIEQDASHQTVATFKSYSNSKAVGRASVDCPAVAKRCVHPGDMAERMRQILEASRNLRRLGIGSCDFMKTQAGYERCLSEVKMRDYVETTARVVIGFMLAATGIFHIVPEAADNFFPWLAE